MWLYVCILFEKQKRKREKRRKEGNNPITGFKSDQEPGRGEYIIVSHIKGREASFTVVSSPKPPETLLTSKEVIGCGIHWGDSDNRFTVINTKHARERRCTFVFLLFGPSPGERYIDITETQINKDYPVLELLFLAHSTLNGKYQ